MANNILVSVCMITYNHSEFIKQAIEGILMQKCNFEVELIIADDLSPDNTKEIVTSIINEHKNGSWIKYTRHPVNKGMMDNFKWVLSQAEGKYIALCEGDDYWTDPFKLQKQVDIMLNNEDLSLIVHQAQIIDGTTGKPVKLHTKENISRSYSLEEILKNGGGNFATNSMLFKKEFVLETPTYFKKVSVGDFPLMIHLALCGIVFYSKEIMSIYRSDVPESWTNRVEKDSNALAKVCKELSEMLEEVNIVSGFKYEYLFQDIIHRYNFKYNLLVGNYKSIRDDIYSDVYTEFIKSLSNKNKLSFYIKIYCPSLYKLLFSLRHKIYSKE